MGSGLQTCGAFPRVCVQPSSPPTLPTRAHTRALAHAHVHTRANVLNGPSFPVSRPSGGYGTARNPQFELGVPLSAGRPIRASLRLERLPGGPEDAIALFVFPPLNGRRWRRRRKVAEPQEAVAASRFLLGASVATTATLTPAEGPYTVLCCRQTMGESGEGPLRLSVESDLPVLLRALPAVDAAGSGREIDCEAIVQPLRCKELPAALGAGRHLFSRHPVGSPPRLNFTAPCAAPVSSPVTTITRACEEAGAKFFDAAFPPREGSVNHEPEASDAVPRARSPYRSYPLSVGRRC